jgi:hypothetical protein
MPLFEAGDEIGRIAGLARVIAADPAHQSSSGEDVDRVEDRLGYSVSEVVHLPRRHPVQAEDQLGQVLIAG